jgi:lipoprotein-anchoring transpeptidase ErfK/SrfK
VRSPARIAVAAVGATALCLAVLGTSSHSAVHGAAPTLAGSIDPNLAGAIDPNLAGAIDVGAAANSGAQRGAAMQVTDTLPPPPPLQPGDSLDVPANSGSGRRIVYSKGIQRIWLIEVDEYNNETLYNTHRVSGRMDEPPYGTYTVWSRSDTTCAVAHPDICMRWMVRFAINWKGNNIGFHEIPSRNGVPLQTDDQLGLALSGGCVRQATADALITWNWASIGTVVVVVP